MRRLCFIALIVMKCLLWTSGCESSPRFRKKEVVGMDQLRNRGMQTFNQKVSEKLAHKRREDAYQMQQHSKEQMTGQRLMKTKKAGAQVLNLALICPVLVLCSQRIVIKIRITDIIHLDCNQKNFNPRYCKKDCETFDYKIDPRCLDCKDKNKDEDICINCESDEYKKNPIKKYQKEKCCLEAMKDLDPDRDSDYDPIQHCCKFDSIKDSEKCGCDYFFRYNFFTIKYSNRVLECCEDEKYKYTDRCSICKTEPVEICCENYTLDQINSNIILSAYCCEKKVEGKCNCQNILSNPTYKSQYGPVWEFCCKENPSHIECDECYKDKKELYNPNCCLKYLGTTKWTDNAKTQCCGVFNENSNEYKKHCLNCDNDKDKDKEECLSYNCEQLVKQGITYEGLMKLQKQQSDLLNQQQQNNEQQIKAMIQSIQKQHDLLKQCCDQELINNEQCKEYNTCDNEEYFEKNVECCLKLYNQLNYETYNAQIDAKLQKCCKLFNKDNFCKCQPKVLKLVSSIGQSIQNHNYVLGDIEKCCDEIDFNKNEMKKFETSCCNNYKQKNKESGLYSNYGGESLRMQCCRESLNIANKIDFEGDYVKYYQYCCSLLPNTEICKKQNCIEEQFSESCCGFYLEGNNINRYKQHAKKCCMQYNKQNKDKCNCQMYMKYKIDIPFQLRDECCREIYLQKQKEYKDDQEKIEELKEYYKKYMPYCLGNCFVPEIKYMTYSSKLVKAIGSEVMAGFETKCCHDYIALMQAIYKMTQKGEKKQIKETVEVTTTITYTNSQGDETVVQETETRQIIKTYTSYEASKEAKTIIKSLHDTCCQFNKQYEKNTEVCKPKKEDCKKTKNIYNRDCCLELFQSDQVLDQNVLQSCCEFFKLYQNNWEYLKFMYPLEQYPRTMPDINKICNPDPNNCEKIMASPFIPKSYKIQFCCTEMPYKTQHDICKKYTCTQKNCNNELAKLHGKYTWTETEQSIYDECCFCDYFSKLGVKRGDTGGQIQDQNNKISQNAMNVCNPCSRYSILFRNGVIQRNNIPAEILKKCCNSQETVKFYKTMYDIDLQNMCYQDPQERCLWFPAGEDCCSTFANKNGEIKLEDLIDQVASKDMQNKDRIRDILQKCCITDSSFYFKYCNKDCGPKMIFEDDRCCPELMENYFQELKPNSVETLGRSIPYKCSILDNQKTDMMERMYTRCCDNSQYFMQYYKKCISSQQKCEEIVQKEGQNNEYIIKQCCNTNLSFMQKYRDTICCKQDVIFNDYLQIYMKSGRDQQCCKQNNIISGNLDKWHDHCCLKESFQSVWPNNCCKLKFSILNSQQKQRCCLYFKTNRMDTDLNTECCSENQKVFDNELCCTQGFYQKKCCSTLFDKKKCCDYDEYKDRKECKEDIPPLIFPPFEFCEYFPLFCGPNIWIIVVPPVDPDPYCIKPCCCVDNYELNLFCHCKNINIIVPPPPPIKYDLCLNNLEAISNDMNQPATIDGLLNIINTSTFESYSQIMKSLAICLCQKYGVFCHQCFFNSNTDWCVCHPIFELLGYHRHKDCPTRKIYIPPNRNCLQNFRTFFGRKYDGLWTEYAGLINQHIEVIKKYKENSVALTHEYNKKLLEKKFSIDILKEQFDNAFFDIDNCCNDFMMTNLEFGFDNENQIGVELNPEYKKLLSGKESIETPKGNFKKTQRQQFYTFMCKRDTVDCEEMLKTSKDQYTKLKESVNKLVTENKEKDTSKLLLQVDVKSLQTLRHETMHCCLARQYYFEENNQPLGKTIKDVCCPVLVNDQKLQKDIDVIKLVGMMSSTQLDYYYKKWNCEEKRQPEPPTCDDIEKDIREIIQQEQGLIFRQDGQNMKEYNKLLVRLNVAIEQFKKDKCCDLKDKNYLFCTDEDPEPNCLQFFMQFRTEKFSKDQFEQKFKQCCSIEPFSQYCCDKSTVAKDKYKVEFCCNGGYLKCCNEKAEFKYSTLFQGSELIKFQKKCCQSDPETCCDISKIEMYLTNQEIADTCCAYDNTIKLCKSDCNTKIYLDRDHPMHQICCQKNIWFCPETCEESDKGTDDFQKRCCDKKPYIDDDKLCPPDCEKLIETIEKNSEDYPETVRNLVITKCCSKFKDKKLCKGKKNCLDLFQGIKDNNNEITEQLIDSAKNNGCCEDQEVKKQFDQAMIDKICPDHIDDPPSKDCSDLIGTVKKQGKQALTDDEKEKYYKCCKLSIFIFDPGCPDPEPVPSDKCEECGEIVASQEVYYTEAQRRLMNKIRAHKHKHYQQQHHKKKENKHHRR